MAGEDIAQAQDVAAGTVRNAGALIRAVGCTVSKTGVGDYKVTILPLNNAGPNVANVETISWAQVTGLNAQRIISVEDTGTESEKNVLILDALGNPIDTDFEFRIGRLLGSGSGV